MLHLIETAPPPPSPNRQPPPLPPVLLCEYLRARGCFALAPMVSPEPAAPLLLSVSNRTSVVDHEDLSRHLEMDNDGQQMMADKG